MIINKKKNGGKWKRSSLESLFERIWEEKYPHLTLHTEQYMIEGRRMRSDYVHYPSKTVIEVNGGMYIKKGGHTTGEGARRDYFKSNTLITMGYVTIFLATGEVTESNIDMVCEIINQRSF